MVDPSSRRIAAVDAARGLAMILSCLAHFAWWIEPVYSSAAMYLTTVAKIATPCFLLMSGAMAGLLSLSKNLKRLRVRLLLRGIFLLTGGHALVSLAEAHRDGGFIHTLGSATIIDDIGLATILAALGMPFLSSARVRSNAALIAAACFVVIWVIVLAWNPHSTVAEALESTLLGGSPSAPESFSYTGPTLQYIAIYALGLPLGGLFASVRTAKLSSAALERLLLRVSQSLFAVVILLKAGRLAWAGLTHQTPGWLGFTTEIGQKHPPSPAYLCFYSACSLVLLAGLFRAARLEGVAKRGLRWLSVLGRASLFVFIVQYFLYWTLPDLLGIAPGLTAPLVFLGNIAIAWFLARLWISLTGKTASTSESRAP